MPWKMLLSAALLTVFMGTLCEADKTQQGAYRLATGATYVIVAPKKVRPNMVYQIQVTINTLTSKQVRVRSSLSVGGEEYARASDIFSMPGTKRLELLIPETITNGSHKLFIEGVTNTGVGQVLFQNETKLEFSSKWVSLFIQTDRPVYNQDQLVTFRVLGVYPNTLKPVSGTITIYVLDAKKNIVWRFLTHQLNLGIYTGSFQLSYPFNEGVWTLSVEGFGHTYTETFRAELFWTRHHEVNLTMPLYVMDSEWGIMGEVYGEHKSSIMSKGEANIIARLKDEKGEFISGEITRKVILLNSKVTFSFSLEEMREVWGTLAGTELHVVAHVTDWEYVETQQASASTKIIKDGVRLRLLGRRLRSFKPGIPFTAYFAVERTDGSPYVGDNYRAMSVQVKHEAGSSRTLPETRQIIPDDNIIRVTVYPRQQDRRIIIRVWHPLMGEARDNVIAYRYYSPSNVYMSIGTSTEQPQVDEYIIFTVRTSVYVEEVNYLVLAGANILFGNSIRMLSTQKTFSIAASRAMSPRARVVAYFIREGELISDTINIYVKDTRLTTASLELNTGKDFSGDTVELIGRGDPGGMLVLTGNDHQWWLRGAHSFLEEEDVVAELASYDDPYQGPYKHTWWYDDERWEDTIFFPSPTTGMDTVTAFEMAGLQIFSDMNMTFMDINPVTCNRSLGLGRCPNGQCYQLDKWCDGHMDCTDGYDEVSCPEEEPSERRSAWIDGLHRMIRYYGDSQWAWKSTYIMPYGSAHVTLDVPQATDPWVISGFVLHPEYGLSLVTDPIQLDTTRTFFLGMRLPESARRGEQLGIECSVFNNQDERIEVIVMLHGGDDYRFVSVETNGVVSSYAPNTKAGDIQTMVELNPGEAKYVFFPVIPIIESGEIEISISAFSFYRKDTQTATVEISWDGITNDDHTPFLIDLINQGSVIIPDFYIPIPEQFIHPEEPYHRYVPGSQWAAMSLFGDVVSPGFFEDYLNTDNVIGIPWDNAEGRMFDFAVTLQTMRYLQATSQLTRDAMEKAIEFLKSALMRQYSYIQDDGSVKMFLLANKPCLWETAFVCKTLHAALNSQWDQEIFIEKELISKIASWIVSQQQEDGSFYETSDYVYDRKMQPWTVDEEGNAHNWSIPLTAYVTIALSSLSRLQGDLIDSAKGRAAQYLSYKMGQITDPYQMAITAYALTMADHKDKDNAFGKLSRIKREGEGHYWSAEEIEPNEITIIQTVQYMQPRADFTNLATAISATAYGLKLYLGKNRFEESVDIMKWLQTQRNGLMGYSSTQDTLLALEALAEFALFETNRFIYQLEVHLESSFSPEWSETIRLNSSNFATLFEAEIPLAHGQIQAWAKGTGYAVLQMDAEHNIEKPFQIANADYDSFEIDYNYTSSGRNASHVHMIICTRWIRPDIADQTGMSVVYVDVPTGYMVSRGVVERMYDMRIPGIKNIEFRNPTLFVTWEYMTQDWQCFNFTYARWFPVANVSIQHGIGIFEYMETGFFYDTLYTAHTMNHLHICQVCGSFQCPYCPFYNHGAIPSQHFLLMFLSAILCAAYHLDTTKLGLWIYS